MISFGPFMKNEKIAIIALVIIIAGALSLFLISSFGGDIFSNLFNDSTPPPVGDNIIEEGDCADVQYIGRYASNNTIFDTSYEDVAIDAGIYDDFRPYDPLKIFVTLEGFVTPPEGYEEYSSGIIEGLLSRLIGTQEGESYVFTIPPEEAYGSKKLKVGDQFYSSSFALNTINMDLSLNQTLEVTRLTDTNLSLKWVNVETYGNFTMPQIVINDLTADNQQDMILIPPPYFIWENSSEIVAISDDTVSVRTTPTKTEQLYDSFELIYYGFEQEDVFSIFPNATTVSYNETMITLTSDPEIGSEYEYSYSYFGQEITMTYTIENITEDTIGLTIVTQGTDEIQTQEVIRSLSFSRNYEFPRTYRNIPRDYQDALIGMDLEREGYSIHHLAGETLIFEVTIENVYKTS